MLRKMCKICARENRGEDRDIYKQRILTGEVISSERSGLKIKKIIECTECGNTWSFSKRVKGKK